MDIEFTVERGEFFCLQCRAGKRTGRAALRIACEMVDEKLITPSRAIMLVDPTHVDQLLHPHFDPSDVVTPGDVVARGLAASPGAAVGEAVFQASRAEALAKAGRDVVLLRKETSAEDVGGLHAARGVATQRGGMTSHAAVVARGWGKPCVLGARRCPSTKTPNARRLKSSAPTAFPRRWKSRRVMSCPSTATRGW
jgi:pyruvate,orthophosphate dikinase